MTICNREALAVVRMPTEAEEQLRAIHRQHEQLVKARKQLEAQGRHAAASRPRTGTTLYVSARGPASFSSLVHCDGLFLAHNNSTVS
jgi:hypothetical protein